MQKFSGMDWLRIDIANHMGLDKELWDVRLDFVRNAEKDLEDPFYIEQADKPYLYQKAVRAYRKAQRGEPTGFIMALDATCSGGQIMAALVGCDATAEQTNLVPVSTRQDLYTNQVNKMNTILDPSKQILLKEDPTNSNAFTRQDIKDAMIPVFYGSKSSVKRAFGKGSEEFSAFNEAVNELIPGVMYCLDRIIKCWDDEALHHTWTLPDGHVAHCKVYEPEDRMVQPDNLDGFQFVQRVYLNKSSEYGVSLAANVVHSIDGYVVREMVRRMAKERKPMTAIHK